MKLKDGTMNYSQVLESLESKSWFRTVLRSIHGYENTIESGRKAKKPWVWESGCGYRQINQEVWRNW